MSEYGGSSSDLSEIEDGAALKSDLGSNQSEHEDTDQDAESAPDTEAETERLEISPQKPKSTNGIADAGPESSPHRPVGHSTDASQPGLTAQDILGNAPASSDEDKDSIIAGSTRNQAASANLGGRKRKRPASVSAHVAHPSGSPPKRRSYSMRLDRQALAKSHEDTPELNHDETEHVVMETSADEAPDLEIDAPDTSQQNTPRPPGEEDDDEEEEEEEAPLNEPAEDEEEEAVEGEEGAPDAEADAAAKTEDELAKKKVAMDALVPIEKLFAIFRDKLFDERWAELSAELDLLNTPNTTHADYLAMRQTIDTRRDEKVHIEQVLLQYKIKALETRITAQRASIQAQYFQTVRQVREDYMNKLNEQFSRIQRERRHFKTKEPYYGYKFEPKRSKQIANQTAYNTEVSLLSGIARNLGFPAAPEMRPATQQDVEDDLRQMRIPVRPQTRPLSTQIGRAEEAATEEQFLEKNPWANPQHPAHQQARMNNRNYLDAARPPSSTPANRMTDHQKLPAGTGSTIGLHSDPPSGLAYSDAMPNGSSPYEQMHAREDERQKADTNYTHKAYDSHEYHSKSVLSSEPPEANPAAAHVSDNVTASTLLYTAAPTDHISPRPNDTRPYDVPRDPQDHYQTPPLAPRDGNFAQAHETFPNNLGIARSFGVR